MLGLILNIETTIDSKKSIGFKLPTLTIKQEMEHGKTPGSVTVATIHTPNEKSRESDGLHNLI